MRFFIFLLFIFYFSNPKLLAREISLEVQNPITDKNGDVWFVLKGLLNPSDYYLKINSSDTSIEYFDTEKNSWLRNFSIISKLPQPVSKFFIRIKTRNFVYGKVEIVLIEKRTGDKLTIKDINIWDGIWYRNYINLLNNNLFSL